MKHAKKEAISSAAVVLIIIGSVVGILAAFYVLGENTYCLDCGGQTRAISLTSATLNANTSTFSFTINNPFPTEQKISSVMVNQKSCNSNFAPLNASYVTLESCVVSGTTFTKGEVVNYIVNFANSQDASGSIIAQ